MAVILMLLAQTHLEVTPAVVTLASLEMDSTAQVRSMYGLHSPWQVLYRFCNY